jgi:hypothetical protein
MISRALQSSHGKPLPDSKCNLMAARQLEVPCLARFSCAGLLSNAVAVVPPPKVEFGQANIHRAANGMRLIGQCRAARNEVLQREKTRCEACIAQDRAYASISPSHAAQELAHFPFLAAETRSPEETALSWQEYLLHNALLRKVGMTLDEAVGPAFDASTPRYERIHLLEEFLQSASSEEEEFVVAA